MKTLKRGTGSSTFAARDYRDEFLNHAPTTDIIEQIRAATPSGALLEKVKITPAVAQDLLTLNTANRPIKINTVQRYTDTMAAGKWIFTGDVIKISAAMQLIDSQQRLIAIVQSKTTQVMHIQTGLSPDAFAVLDSGRMRTAGDVLAVEGHTSYNILSAAIKADIYYHRYKTVGARIQGTRVSNQDIIDWTKNNNAKLIKKCLDYAVNTLHVKGKFITHSTWTFIYYLFSTIHQTQAKEFVTLLASGEGLSMKNNNPIYLLREKLLTFKGDRSLAGIKNIDVKMRYILAAWNAWRRGEVLSKLTIDTKTATLEKAI